MISVPRHRALHFGAVVTHHPISGLCTARSRLAIYRLASTSTASSKGVPNSEKSLKASSSSAINPPASTLPPRLDLPTRQSDQSAVRYYLNLGKAYFAFYKDAIKATFANRRTAQSIRARIPRNLSLEQALENGDITRGEWQLIRRSTRDMRKVPILGVILFITGEFTPLVVLAIGSSVVPGTCRIPAQITKERQKLEERRSKSFKEGTLDSAEGKPGSEADDTKGGQAMEVNWNTLDRRQLQHIGISLNLHGKLWDYVGGLPGLLLKGRANRWQKYIMLDDNQLGKGESSKVLSVDEVRIACEERGLDVLGVPDEKLRKQLQDWQRLRSSQGYKPLLLKRPSAWL